MTRRMYSLIILTLLILTAVIPMSCTAVTSAAESIVQVWVSDTMVASGVAAGDGTQVLTVLDYIHSPPHEISVATTDGIRYRAFVVALDPRTSVTLLKVEGVRLPVDSLASIQTVIEPDQAVIVLGWFRSVVSTEKRADNIHEVLGDPRLRKIRTSIVTEASGSPPQFNLRTSNIGEQSAQPGDVVIGKDGKIVGLIGNGSWGPIPAPVPAGYIPPVITISSALELLSADYQQRPWVKGPVGYAILTANTATAYLKVPDNYQVVSDSIQQLLNSLGNPIPLEDLQQANPRFVLAPKSGKLLVAIYAFPVELRSAEDTLLAMGRWIGIAWDRFDQLDVLFYSKEGADIEGGFELSDVSVLERNLQVTK